MLPFTSNSRLGRGLLLAAVVAGASAFALPALAGECPADQKKPNAREAVDLKPVGVTDTVIASIDVAKAPFNIDGRNFRMRKLTIEPGGIVPWHSHADRPAIIYIIEGEIVEYASELRRADRAQGRRRRCRDPGRFALVEEPRRQDRRAALRRPAEGYERPQHVRASSPRPPRLDVTPRFPSPRRGVTSISLASIKEPRPCRRSVTRCRPPSPRPTRHSAGAFFRSIVIALTAFLTLVDLFATQAILPMLTEHYGVTPGQMGLRFQCEHLRHARLRPRRRLFLEQHRPAPRHPDQPRPARRSRRRCSPTRPISPSSPFCA